MDEAEALCDRIAIFDKGRVVANGTPSEIIAAHAVTSRISYTPTPAGPGIDWARAPGVVNVEHSAVGRLAVLWINRRPGVGPRPG